jgi:uncharacterized protein
VKEPIRTCLGCRGARPKSLLVRLVRDPTGTVSVDGGGRGIGRGAYVCADPACVERALKGGRLAHAFRRPCEPRLDLVSEVRAGRNPVAGSSREIKSMERAAAGRVPVVATAGG